MDQLQIETQELHEQVRNALTRIGYADLQVRKAQLDQAAADPDLWHDNEKAQNVLREQAALDRRLTPWQNLDHSLDDLSELTGLDDDSLHDDLARQLLEAQTQFSLLKEELKFNGPYDDHDAILSIHAGAGGTDAQDWTSMLLRMYVRYGEQAGWQVSTVEESAGEEAGLKSVTLEISGSFVYGKLKGEHGVHRLVRLSPFNAESRETSFAKVEVTPKIDAPEELAIDEKELKIDVYRSGCSKNNTPSGLASSKVRMNKPPGATKSAPMYCIHISKSKTSVLATLALTQTTSLPVTSTPL
jgi:peptide chain release factor 2